MDECPRGERAEDRVALVLRTSDNRRRVWAEPTKSFGVSLGERKQWNRLAELKGRKDALHETSATKGVDVLNRAGRMRRARTGNRLADEEVGVARAGPRPEQRRIDARGEDYFAVGNGRKSRGDGRARIARDTSSQNERRQLSGISSDAPPERVDAARIEPQQNAHGILVFTPANEQVSVWRSQTKTWGPCIAS